MSHGHFYAISPVIHNDSFEKVDFNIHSDYKSYENLEFFWNFWNLIFFWKFRNFMKFNENLNFLKILKSCEHFEFFFWNFEISEFSLIDDEVWVFRMNIKLLSNPVAELKIRETVWRYRSNSKRLLTDDRRYSYFSSLDLKK